MNHCTSVLFLKMAEVYLYKLYPDVNCIVGGSWSDPRFGFLQQQEPALPLWRQKQSMIMWFFFSPFPPLALFPAMATSYGITRRVSVSDDFRLQALKPGLTHLCWFLFSVCSKQKEGGEGVFRTFCNFRIANE